MNEEFTAEEINLAARTARIYCQGFSEEKLQSLMELAGRVGESDYLETVDGVHRLEKDNGIPITKILDACQELLEREKKLERGVADFELRLTNQEELLRQAQARYSEVREATTKAEQGLAEIVAQREKEEKALRVFQRRAETEKQRIEKEVTDSRQRANVSKEEVIAAGQIKAEVEKHGLTLELVLELSKEFAGYGDAREKLTAGLKKHGSLKKYLKELEEWGEGRRTALLSETSHREAQNKQLEDNCHELESALSQLRADEFAEQNLRQFYALYGGLGKVLDQLVRWNQVYPMRCNNPAYIIAKALNPSAGCARVWTDKPLSTKCPFCGLNTLGFDVEVYEALGMPVGAPLQFYLGG